MRIDAHIHDSLCHKDIQDTKQYVADCARAGIDGIVLIATPNRHGFSEDCFDAAERFGDFVIPVLLSSELETLSRKEVKGRLFEQWWLT